MSQYVWLITTLKNNYAGNSYLLNDDGSKKMFWKLNADVIHRKENFFRIVFIWVQFYFQNIILFQNMFILDHLFWSCRQSAIHYVEITRKQIYV